MLGFIGIAMLAAAAHQSRRSLSGTPDEHRRRWKTLMKGAADPSTEWAARDRALTRADEEALWFGGR